VNVLLIRLRLLGDVVFTTPAVRALRRRFPDARLTYLVERAAAPAVLSNPHLDEVVVVPHTRGLQRMIDDVRLAKALRARRFDVVIDFHGGPRASWLAWATGAPRRIGYTIPGRGWIYTDRIDRPRELRPRHSVENQWDLLAALDVPPPDRAADAVEMTESADARERVAHRLGEHGVTDDTTIVVLHVSAGNPFRRWPAASFADLAARLAAADPSRRIVLTSGPSESGAADAVAGAARERLGSAGGRVLRCGDFDLPELRALAGLAALYVGGDSGPLHVAATTSTPIVALFGPTLAARSEPWRDPGLVAEIVEPGPLACRPCDQRTCVTGDYRCLTGIDAARVAHAAERALSRDAAWRRQAHDDESLARQDSRLRGTPRQSADASHGPVAPARPTVVH
jgi:lipopolysaccharide heptosyltransferase II